MKFGEEEVKQPDANNEKEEEYDEEYEYIYEEEEEEDEPNDVAPETIIIPESRLSVGKPPL